MQAARSAPTPLLAMPVHGSTHSGTNQFDERIHWSIIINNNGRNRRTSRQKTHSILIVVAAVVIVVVVIPNVGCRDGSVALE